jgi:hypothetical protein
MSYKNKNRYVRVPFHIRKANGVKDDFTVQFKPKTATKFRASDEFTKFIDDDYSVFLKASLINSNAAKQFTMRGAGGRQSAASSSGFATPIPRGMFHPQPGGDAQTETDIEADYGGNWADTGVDREEEPDGEAIAAEERARAEARASAMGDFGRNMAGTEEAIPVPEPTEPMVDEDEVAEGGPGPILEELPKKRNMTAAKVSDEAKTVKKRMSDYKPRLRVAPRGKAQTLINQAKTKSAEASEERAQRRASDKNLENYRMGEEDKAATKLRAKAKKAVEEEARMAEEEARKAEEESRKAMEEVRKAEEEVRKANEEVRKTKEKS